MQSLALFVAVVTVAVYIAKAISNTIDETKKTCESLPLPLFPSHPISRLGERGVNVTASGISVKTSKHMTREDYLDATQR